MNIKKRNPPDCRFSPRVGPAPLVKAHSKAERVGLTVDGKSRGFGRKKGTVFMWEDVDIGTCGRHKIGILAEFGDGKILEDEGEWEVLNNESD